MMTDDDAREASRLTLENAFAVHSQWKRRLQDAVATGESLDVSTIRRDDCCDLGRWLNADGKRFYGHFPEFFRLLDSHTEFHIVTGVVANLINCKESETAKRMISGNSQFSAASMEVGLAINALKKVALG